MNSFTTFRGIFLVAATIVSVIPSVKPFDCSPPSGQIKCECTATTAACFGTQVHILESEDIFKNVSEFETVIYRINDLQIEPDFMLENSSIKNLTLGYTKYGLQVLSPRFFTGLSSSLVSLNLENNSITDIDDDFFSDFPLLTELLLDKNELENLTSNTFVSLSNLKYLSISYNRISDITPEVFQKSTVLETLTLSHNSFSSIESVNVESDSLTTLKVDNCLIEGLIQKDTLMKIPNTEYLDMSYNKISGIEKHALSFLKSLKYLNLSYNVIEYLEENAFSGVSNLTTLDLHGNRISVIKLTSFEKLQNLKYFDLSGNKLKAVLCEYTTDFTSLESIYLQNNGIQGFTQGAFFYSPNLKVIDLTGNNLECSCALTDSASYLIKNGSMDSNHLKSVSCIITSTGSQLPLTKYESSKCHVLDEPCKKIEISNEEDYEDVYDDSTSSVVTGIASSTLLSTENTSLKESTTQFVTNETETVHPINKLLTTHEYNTSNTASISTDSTESGPTSSLTSKAASTTFLSTETTSLEESTTLIFTTQSFINESETEDSMNSLLTSPEYNTSNTMTSSTESENTKILFTDTSTVSYTERFISDNSSEIPNTTLSVSNEITSSHTFSTPTTEKFTASSSTVTNKIISPDSEADCSLLQLSINNASSSSNLTILQNFSNSNNNFCLKWTAGGIEGLKIRCSLKYTTTAGTKVVHLKCPSVSYEIKDWTKNEKIFKFCITIYPEKMKKQESCKILSSTKDSTKSVSTINTITTTSTASPESSTDKLLTMYDKTTDATSTISVAPTESTTEKSFTSLETTDTNSVLYTKQTSDTTFTMSDTAFNEITATTSVFSPIDFSILTLNLHFNDSKLAFTTWTVNKWQTSDKCNLTLKVSTQYFDEIEGVFPCKNNTYRLTKVKENDIFKICLFSHHVTSGKDNLCQHTLPSARASASKDDSLNSSLIPLICLLLLVGLLVLFIVIRNISKMRSVSKKYDVRAEEEKYQERVKLRPQSIHEESVRFSYIAKENHECN